MFSSTLLCETSKDESALGPSAPRISKCENGLVINIKVQGIIHIKVRIRFKTHQGTRHSGTVMYFTHGGIRHIKVKTDKSTSKYKTHQHMRPMKDTSSYSIHQGVSLPKAKTQRYDKTITYEPHQGIRYIKVQHT